MQAAQAKSPILICTLHTAYLADKVKVAVKVVGWVLLVQNIYSLKSMMTTLPLVFDRIGT